MVSIICNDYSLYSISNCRPVPCASEGSLRGNDWTWTMERLLQREKTPEKRTVVKTATCSEDQMWMGQQSCILHLYIWSCWWVSLLLHSQWWHQRPYFFFFFFYHKVTRPADLARESLDMWAHANLSLSYDTMDGDTEQDRDRDRQQQQAASCALLSHCFLTVIQLMN